MQAGERWLEAEVDLRDSLVGLSRLGMTRLGLVDILTRVAGFGAQGIPGADGAGLTLREDDRQDTVVSTAAFVSKIDDVQSGIRQGPGLSAVREARTVLSGSLGADPRWPQFGGRVARLGVHSVMSLPLVTIDGVIGAMTVYGHAKYAFDDRAAELGEIFAAPAAVVVENAHSLDQAQRLAARLQAALADRRVIDRAVGIFLSRNGGTEQDALDRLRTLSQHEQLNLPDVARHIVDEAVRRAHARHHDCLTRAPSTRRATPTA